MTNGSLMKVKSIAEYSPEKYIKYLYSKICVKRPLKNRQNKDLYDKW